MTIHKEDISQRIRSGGGYSILPSTDSICCSASCLVLPNRFYFQTQNRKLQRKMNCFSKTMQHNDPCSSSCLSARNSFDLYNKKLPNLLPTCRKKRKYSCDDQCYNPMLKYEWENRRNCKRSISPSRSKCRESSRPRCCKSRRRRSEDSVYFNERKNSYHEFDPYNYRIDDRQQRYRTCKPYNYRCDDRHQQNRTCNPYNYRCDDRQQRYTTYNENECGPSDYWRDYRQPRNRTYRNRDNNDCCYCDLELGRIEKPYFPDRQGLRCKFNMFRKSKCCCRQKPITYNCDGCNSSDSDLSFLCNKRDSLSGTRICRNLSRSVSGNSNIFDRNNVSLQQLLRDNHNDIPNKVSWSKMQNFNDLNKDCHSSSSKFLDANDIPHMCSNFRQKDSNESMNENNNYSKDENNCFPEVIRSKIASNDGLAARQMFGGAEPCACTSILKTESPQETEEYPNMCVDDFKIRKYLPQITQKNSYVSWNKASNGRRLHCKKSFKHKLSGFFKYKPPKAYNRQNFLHQDPTLRQYYDWKGTDEISNDQIPKKLCSSYLRKFRKSISSLVINKKGLPHKRNKKIEFYSPQDSNENHLSSTTGNKCKPLIYPTVFRSKYIGEGSNDNRCSSKCNEQNTNYRSIKSQF